MSNLTVKGNASGTGTVILEAPNTNSNRTITLPDAATTLVGTADFASQAQAQAGTDNTKLMTPLRVAEAIIAQSPPTTFMANQSTASGSAFDFTGIPSTAREIEVLFQATSMNDASDPAVQLIVGGTPITSGYVSGSASSGADSSATGGFHIYNDSTVRSVSGIMRIVRAASGVWVASHSVSLGSADANGGGLITGVGTVNGIRVTCLGVGAYDAGNVCVTYR